MTRTAKNWSGSAADTINTLGMNQSNSNSKQCILCHDFAKKIFAMFSFNNTKQTKSLLETSIKSKEKASCFKLLLAGFEQKFVCLIYSRKIMCGKMACKVKLLISQDYFTV